LWIAAFGGYAYEVSVTGISFLCFCRPKHGGELATSGGFFPFGASFPSLAGRLYGFPTGESPVVTVFYKLAAKPPTTTLSG